MRVALLALVVILAVPSASRAVEPFDPFGLAGIDSRPGAAAPLDLPFRDEGGRRVTLRTLAAGRPILLVPVQHRCASLCGLTLEGVREAIEGQSYRPGRDFAVVAFGIDPRETPKDSLVSARRLDGHALTGGGVQIRAVTDGLGYRYAWDPASGQYAHIAAVAVLTADGRLARWLRGLDPPASDVQLALTEAGRGKLGGLGQQVRLLCFHYDPAAGRYSPIVWHALQLVGGLTVGSLVLAVLAAVWRERRRART